MPEHYDGLMTEYETVLERRTHPAEGSYTCYLFEQGLDKILKKVGEECSETIIAAKNEDSGALIGEVSDLLYHLMVLLVQKEIRVEEVYAELARRSGKQGNLKQFHQVDRNT